MEPGGDKGTVDIAVVQQLRHDIRNQLSGMILCLEQLRFELNDPPPDWKYYMDAISDGCKNINNFLDDVG